MRASHGFEHQRAQQQERDSPWTSKHPGHPGPAILDIAKTANTLPKAHRVMRLQNTRSPDSLRMMLDKRMPSYSRLFTSPTGNAFRDTARYRSRMRHYKSFPSLTWKTYNIIGGHVERHMGPTRLGAIFSKQGMPTFWNGPTCSHRWLWTTDRCPYKDQDSTCRVLILLTLAARSLML